MIVQNPSRDRSGRAWRRGAARVCRSKGESDAQGQAAFDRFITCILRFGYADFCYRIRHVYWALDEYRHWTMGWPVEETVVINPAPLVDGPKIRIDSEA